MKRGELIERGIAAGITIAFMAAVRPDPDPPLAGVALVALLMYEGILWCMGHARKMRRQEEEDRYDAWIRSNSRRWADEEIRRRA